MLNDVKQYLEENKIKYINHKHAPIFTADVSEKVSKDIPGVHCKNLFMKDKKGGQLYMYTLPARSRADLKEVAIKVGAKYFSLCNSQVLMDILRVEPGHVSPMCLIHESSNEVIWIIDKDVFEADIVGFHPNENDQTLEINKENFHKLIESFPHKKVII